MSESPVPPEVVNVRFCEPAGTTIVYVNEVPVAATRPVTGTPRCRTVPVGGGGGGVTVPCVFAISPRKARPSLANLALLAAEELMFASVSAEEWMLGL